MARNTFEDRAWLPEETDSDVIKRVNQLSAVELFASRVPMSTGVKNIPRTAEVGLDVSGKGDAYNEDTATNDGVVLTARKFTRGVRIAEEDLDDSPQSIIAEKQMAWATSYAKGLDNACLATTATANGTTVPFTSVYLAASGVSNLTQTGTGGISYDNLSAALGKLENSDYFDESRVVVAASPAVRESLRGIKDTQNNPIFVQGLAGTPDTIFGHPVQWTQGAKTSAVATPSPTGNPLVIFVNQDYLRLGVRSGPESMVIPANVSNTDEALLKLRSRRGFVLGIGNAASVLEDNS